MGLTARERHAALVRREADTHFAADVEIQDRAVVERDLLLARGRRHIALRPVRAFRCEPPHTCCQHERGGEPCGPHRRTKSTPTHDGRQRLCHLGNSRLQRRPHLGHFRQQLHRSLCFRERRLVPRIGRSPRSKRLRATGREALVTFAPPLGRRSFNRVVRRRRFWGQRIHDAMRTDWSASPSRPR